MHDPPKYPGLKQRTFLILTISMGQEFRSRISRRLSFKASHDVRVVWGWRIHSKMAPSHGCCLEASVLHWWASLHDVAAGFFRVSGPRAREGTGRKPQCPYDQVSGAARCHFCFLLLVVSKSLGLAHAQGEGNWAPPPEGRSGREFVDIFWNHLS